MYDFKINRIFLNILPIELIYPVINYKYYNLKIKILTQ